MKIDPHEFDQALAQFRETTPALWWALYQGLMKRGFDEYQSFVLLQTYILAQNPNGSRPPDRQGPKKESDE